MAGQESEVEVAVVVDLNSNKVVGSLSCFLTEMMCFSIIASSSWCFLFRGIQSGYWSLSYLPLQLQIDDQRFEDAEEMEHDTKRDHHWHLVLCIWGSLFLCVFTVILLVPTLVYGTNHSEHLLWSGEWQTPFYFLVNLQDLSASDELHVLNVSWLNSISAPLNYCGCFIWSRDS